MPQNPDIETVHEEAEHRPEPLHHEASELKELSTHASELAHSLPLQPNVQSTEWIVKRRRALNKRLLPLLDALQTPTPKEPVSDDFRWLHDNVRLLYSELQATADSVKALSKIPHAYAGGESVPRAAAVAQGFLQATAYVFSEAAFSYYLREFQQVSILNVRELWGMIPCMKLALLEEVANRGPRVLADKQSLVGVGGCIRSLREIGETSWKEIIEPLVVFDEVLRKDPAGAYPDMDFESRELYRKKIVEIAEHCDFTEMEVAQRVLKLARNAEQQEQANARVKLRRSHVAYYLLAEGRDLLYNDVKFRPSIGSRIQSFLRRHPDAIYVPGIVLLSFIIMSALVLLLTDPYSAPVLIFLSLLALLLPCSESAVQIMNHLTTSLLPAEILPKLDFSDGIPDDCLTLVAVPTLLLSEKQVRRLVDDLEVRFLGNHDPNLHFALVSDLPDSREPTKEDDPLID